LIPWVDPTSTQEWIDDVGNARDAASAASAASSSAARAQGCSSKEFDKRFAALARATAESAAAAAAAATGGGTGGAADDDLQRDDDLAMELEAVMDAQVSEELSRVSKLVAAASSSASAPGPSSCPQPTAEPVNVQKHAACLEVWHVQAQAAQRVLADRQRAIAAVSVETIRPAGAPLAHMSLVQHRAGECDQVVLVNWTNSRAREGQIVPLRGDKPGYAVSGFGQRPLDLTYSTIVHPDVGAAMAKAVRSREPLSADMLRLKRMWEVALHRASDDVAGISTQACCVCEAPGTTDAAQCALCLMSFHTTCLNAIMPDELPRPPGQEAQAPTPVPPVLPNVFQEGLCGLCERQRLEMMHESVDECE